MFVQKLSNLKRFVLAAAAVLLVAVSAYAQNVTVKGTVTDLNGEPVIGAGVLVKGTNTGVSTDIDGQYTITVPRNATLRFTGLNYKEQEIPVNGRAVINVMLQETQLTLDQAVVTAEFGMKRVARSVGSAVQNVKASDIAESGRESFVTALQGRVAGMTITSTSGAPGASTSVVLRNITSVSGNNQPLYVVDGVPINNTTLDAHTDFAYGDAVSMYSMDFASRGNDLNPEDIESMTILKGAAAAALYGSDASNGAIVITTKKGSAGRGKVTYSNSFGWSMAYGIPEIQNKYANGAYGITNYYNTSRFGGLYPSDMKLYNNMEALLQTGFSQTHNFAVEGGTDKVTVRGAASYTDNNGVVKTSNYNRLNITLSGRAEVTKWLNFESKMEYARTGNTKVSKGLYGVLYRASRWPLNDDMSNYITPEGKMSIPELYTDTDLLNPLFAIYKNRNYDSSDRFIGSVGMNVTPTRHTFVRLSYGMDFSVAEYEVHTHPYYGNPTSGSYGYGDYNYSKPTYKDSSLDAIAGYNNDWGKFSFSIQAGYHQKENAVDRVAIYGSKFQVIDFYSIANCDPSTWKIGEAHTKRRIQAISAQVELAWNNMAFLTARARNDWSSTLPKHNNHYFYPAIEGSFVATELPFLKNSDAVSYLKLRGAIAQVGKDARPLSIYPALEATGDQGGGFRYGYTGPNETLKPEMTTSWEVGFEGRFLNDRINTDFTYYWTRCEDQYIENFRLSYATGFVLNNMNVGTFTTQGWEFHIDADILRTMSGFRWNLGLNLDHSTSKVVYLPVDEYYNAYTWLSGNLRNGVMVGYPVTAMTGLGYQRNKKGDILINPGTGLPMAREDWTYMGDRQPLLSGGVTSTMSFKNFRLSAVFMGKFKTTVVNGTKRDMMTTGSSWESVKLRESEPVVFNGVLKNGLEDSDTPTINNIAVTFGNYGSSIWTGTDEDWLETDVNYLRLSELRLSYNIPSKWLQNATRKFVSAANIWVKANDLFVWTNYSGIDAVGNSNSASLGGSGGIGYDVWGLPSPRTLSCGVSLTF